MNFIKKNLPQIIIAVIILGLLTAVYMNKRHGNKLEEEANNASMQAIDEKLGFRPEDYITLGQYKGVNYNQSAAGVSDKELQEAINEELLSYRAVKRAAKNQDGVDVSLKAYIGGKEEKNLKTDNYLIIVGDEELGEDIDKKVLNQSAGYKFEVEVEDPYYFPMEEEVDYSDKKVKYEVVINEVNEPYYEKLTDKWVESAYGEDGIHSVEEYKKAMKDTLLEESAESIKADAQSELWDMVLANAKMDGYPQDLYDDIVAMDDADIKYEAEEMWGMTVEEYCEEFDIDKTELYNKDIKSEMVMWAIAKAENLSISSEELAQAYVDLYEEYGYDTVDEMKADYADYEIERALIETKVVDFIYDNANIVEIPSVESDDGEE